MGGTGTAIRPTLFGLNETVVKELEGVWRASLAEGAPVKAGEFEVTGADQ